MDIETIKVGDQVSFGESMWGIVASVDIANNSVGVFFRPTAIVTMIDPVSLNPIPPDELRPVDWDY